MVWVLTWLSYSGFLSDDCHMVTGLCKISKASSRVWSFILAVSEDLSWVCWLEPLHMAPLCHQGFFGVWWVVPRMNIPREPWENCVVFYDLPLKVMLHYFCCFHKHVRFKGREWTSHTSVEGRGVSITLSDKGWKILSWKTKFATVTWDVSERRQWSAVLVNSSFFTMAQAISTFCIKTEKYIIWSHNYNIGMM